MIALKIRINGEQVLLAGQSDMSILSSHVTVSANTEAEETQDRIRFATHGLSKATADTHPEHFRWKESTLEIGDRVEIEVVRSEQVDEPAKRYRSDHRLQENPFTEDEVREMRYADYLELKKEFEDAEATD